jgi:hypothetical protein
VQPLGATFGGLDGERLQRVRLQVFALRFVFLRALADPRARADDEEATLNRAADSRNPPGTIHRASAADGS